MKTKVIKSANIALRILVMLLAIGFVYKNILERADIKQWIEWNELLAYFRSNIYLFLIVLLLMPLNILLESIKWKVLIDKLEEVKLNKAFTAVLSGISVSMFLPNRTGDYLGRVFILQHASHIKGMLVTIIGSFAQLITTIIAGSIALICVVPTIYELNQSLNFYLYITLVATLLSVIIFLILVFFQLSLLKIIGENIFKKKSEWIGKYAHVFTMYSNNELLKVFALSVFRYLVFSFQFFLMLRILGLQIGYLPSMALISITYLIIMVIPTIAITELGVRGSLSIAVFSMYFQNSALWTETFAFSVLTASTTIWIINIAIPAIAGVVFVYRMKFFRKAGHGS